MIRTAVVALALAALGCGGAEEPRGAVRSAIVYGDPSPSPSADDAIVLLRAMTPVGDHICSATLVAPNLVVTARHCVAELSPGVFTCSRTGELAENPEGGGQLGLDLPPQILEFHSSELPGAEPAALGAEVISSLSPSICSNDVAFVVLDRALDLPIKPVRLGTPTRAGELVTLVGYGLTEMRNTDWRSNPRRRISGREIGEVGPDSVEDPVISAPPRQLQLYGPSACFGDSGGPALIEQTDAVVGVYSVSNRSDCTDLEVIHHFTHLAPFVTLAGRAFEAAGSEPVLEEVPDAGAPDAGCLEESGCADPPREDPASGCSVGVAGVRGTSAGVFGLLLLAAGLSGARRAGRRWLPAPSGARS